MKISNIILASTIILFASCSGNPSDDHGHEHGKEAHGHEHGDGEHQEHHEQEEFTVPSDSIEIEEPAHHMHDDGSEPHNH